MQSGRAGDPGALRTEPWERLDGLSGWHELVLPPAALEQLKSVPAQFGERFWVTSAASLGSGASGGKRGLLLLLGGPPGTGKTLAARALAGALHLPVLQADLEAMFARGRGEATQLVARLFATAQRVGAILVLDRADDVLRAASAGGAPGIAGMAAIDVRDLLRRSEAHPGVVIFPTTISGELSPSILQRFDRVVEFPLPDRAARAEIWRRALPDDARIHEDDVNFLARGFKLSGKQIAGCCAQAERQALRAGRVVLLGDVADVLEPSPELLSAGSPGALAELRRLAGAPAAEAGVVAPEAGVAAPEAVAAPEPPAPPPAPESAPAPGAAAASASASPEADAAPAAADAAQPPDPTVAKPTRRRRARRPRSAAPRLRPARRAGPRLSTRGLVTVALLGALGALVLGLSASERPTHTTTTTTTVPGTLTLDRTAAAGPVRFSYPSSWRLQPASNLTPGPGLTFSHAVTVASTSPPRGQLTVGTTASGGAGTPLPARFIAAELLGNPTPKLVTLGGDRFYRVTDSLFYLGARSQTVYALASGAGAVVALCHTNSQTFVGLCEQALATLRAPPAAVSVPPVKPPAAKLAYARALNAIITKLNAARATGARQLAVAQLALPQAHAARALALAHSRAAAAVAVLNAGRAAGANAALVAALRRVAIAYTELGDAAAVEAPVTFNADRKLVAAANAALTVALDRLKALGYRVG